MRIVVIEEHEAEGTFLNNKNIVFAKKIVLIKNINFDCRPYPVADRCKVSSKKHSK